MSQAAVVKNVLIAAEVKVSRKVVARTCGTARRPSTNIGLPSSSSVSTDDPFVASVPYRSRRCDFPQRLRRTFLQRRSASTVLQYVGAHTIETVTQNVALTLPRTGKEWVPAAGDTRTFCNRKNKIFQNILKKLHLVVDDIESHNNKLYLFQYPVFTNKSPKALY